MAEQFKLTPIPDDKLLPLGLRVRRGKIHFRFKYKGKPHSGSTAMDAVEENIERAEKFLMKVKFDAAECFSKPKKLTVSRLINSEEYIPVNLAVDRFFEFYKSEHKKGKDCKWAKSLLGAFTFYFTDPATKVSLRDIGPGHIQNFKQWRLESTHENTVRKNLILVRQFFSYARLQGWTTRDPFTLIQEDGTRDTVKIPVEDKQFTVWHILTPAEETRYLSAAYKLKNKDHGDVATLMTYQGARPSEIFALEPCDVNLELRQFTIWKSTSQGKSKSAHRTLRMTPKTFPIFERRMKEHGEGRWLFPSRRKKGAHVVTLQKAHEHAEEKSGVKFRIYDLRHTFATRFAVRGGETSLAILAKILGHSDLALLMRYIHPSQDDMNRAMEAFSLGFLDDSTLTNQLVSSHGDFGTAE